MNISEIQPVLALATNKSLPTQTRAAALTLFRLVPTNLRAAAMEDLLVDLGVLPSTHQPVPSEDLQAAQQEILQSPSNILQRLREAYDAITARGERATAQALAIALGTDHRYIGRLITDDGTYIIEEDQDGAKWYRRRKASPPSAPIPQPVRTVAEVVHTCTSLMTLDQLHAEAKSLRKDGFTATRGPKYSARLDDLQMAIDDILAQ